MRWKVVLPVFILLVLVAWGIRVYQVNAGVANQYTIKTYHEGDSISLGNSDLKIKNFSYGKSQTKHGFRSVSAKLVMQLKNTSNHAIDGTKLIATKLTYGRNSYQTMNGNFNVSQLKSLSPNQTANITLTYAVHEKFKGQDAKLYIVQQAYKKLVNKKYKQGKRFGIAVQLKASGH